MSFVLHLGAVDFKWNVSAPDIDASRTYCRTPSFFGCTQEIETVALHYMGEHNLQFPLNSQEARILYDSSRIY